MTAVTYDAVGPGATGQAWTTSPGTWTHVNNGNAIIVALTIFTGNTNTVTGVTYGGVSLNLLKYQVADAAAAGGVVFYGLAGPTVPTGSNTVSVSTSESSNHNGGSISLNNVASFGTPVAASVTGVTSASVSVPGTTTGGMIVTAMCFGGIGTFTGTNSVTIRWQLSHSSSSGSDNGVEGTVASAGGSQTVGFSDSASSDDGSIVAVEALPVTGTDTSPAYASAFSDLGDGLGTWVNGANAEGAPDSTYATWTAP